eukprot:3973585-Amphidinium_carterae.1
MEAYNIDRQQLVTYKSDIMRLAKGLEGHRDPKARAAGVRHHCEPWRSKYHPNPALIHQLETRTATTLQRHDTSADLRNTIRRSIDEHAGQHIHAPALFDMFDQFAKLGHQL